MKFIKIVACLIMGISACLISAGCGGRPVAVSINKDEFKIEGFTLGDDIDKAFDHFKKKFKGKGNFSLENYRDDEFSLRKDGNHILCFSSVGNQSRKIIYMSLNTGCLPGYNEKALEKVFAKKGGLKIFDSLDYQKYYFEENLGIIIDDREWRANTGLPQRHHHPPLYISKTYKLTLVDDSVHFEPETVGRNNLKTRAVDSSDMSPEQAGKAAGKAAANFMKAMQEQAAKQTQEQKAKEE